MSTTPNRFRGKKVHYGRLEEKPNAWRCSELRLVWVMVRGVGRAADKRSSTWIEYICAVHCFLAIKQELRLTTRYLQFRRDLILFFLGLACLWRNKPNRGGKNVALLASICVPYIHRNGRKAHLDQCRTENVVVVEQNLHANNTVHLARRMATTWLLAICTRSLSRGTEALPVILGVICRIWRVTLCLYMNYSRRIKPLAVRAIL